MKTFNDYSETINSGSIGVNHGPFGTNIASDLQAALSMKGGGNYALPGLIEPHAHIDSTLVMPEFLSELFLPHGTTSILVDPMELSNAACLIGLKTLDKSINDLPFHSSIELSSRVATAPGLETASGELGLADVKDHAFSPFIEY